MKNKILLKSIKTVWQDVFIRDITNNFENFISYRQKTEPNSGSPIKNLNDLSLKNIIDKTEKIKINNDSIVLYLNNLVLKFWKIPNKKSWMI